MNDLQNLILEYKKAKAEAVNLKDRIDLLKEEIMRESGYDGTSKFKFQGGSITCGETIQFDQAELQKFYLKPTTKHIRGKFKLSITKANAEGIEVLPHTFSMGSPTLRVR